MAKIFVEKLVNLDFTYFHLTRGLVGETLLVDFTLAGDQNDQGMVLDFGHVKRQIVESLEQAIDHKLVLPVSDTDSNVKIIADDTLIGNSKIFLKDAHHEYELSMPAAGYSALPLREINANTLTSYLLEHLHQQSWWEPSWQATLTLQPERLADNTPFFQYTHGLPKHDGACQRIAHGHRSKLEIFHNQQLDHARMERWCNQWRDIYLGNRQDIASEGAIGGQPSYRFSYVSAEGHYTLEIPKVRCYLLDTETTIENIAQHLANAVGVDIQRTSNSTDNETAEQGKAAEISTRVYEGYQKGAMGHRNI